MNAFWLAPLVVALRTPHLAYEIGRRMAGLPVEADSESERMVAEKFAALQEGTLDAARAMARLQMAVGLGLLAGDPEAAARQMRRAPARIARAAMRPGARRVKANVRRLLPG